MNTYLTGATIKRLREMKKLTQAQLADQIGVSDKAVSRWETGKGFPDISLIDPLAEKLGVSVIELMSGEQIINRNQSANLLRTKFYVCPICGNIIHTTGDTLVSCCGLTLPALEAEEPDEQHKITMQPMEDEVFLTMSHPMTKSHYISFLAYVTSGQVHLVKWYPEGNPEDRIRLRGGGILYSYCNRHGLFKQKV